MSKKFQESKESGIHKELAKLEGKWEGMAKVWFEPGKLADESPVTATIKPILDGRFMLHEYNGSMQGKPLQGMAIIGYDLNMKRYQIAWVDSYHNDTAIMFSMGERSNDQFKVQGSYTWIGPDEEVTWGWRTEIEIRSDDEIVFTAYNIMPDMEAKATEVVYRRVG